MIRRAGQPVCQDRLKANIAAYLAKNKNESSDWNADIREGDRDKQRDVDAINRAKKG